MTEPLQEETPEITKSGVDIELDKSELGGYDDPIADNTWLLAEDMPGEGDKPEWFQDSKYKTVEEQAKAYNELRKVTGDGRAPAEYKMDDLPEEFKDFEFNEESLQGIQEMGKKYNLSNQAYNAVMRAYVEDQFSQRANAEQAEKDYTAAQMKELGSDAAGMITELEGKLDARLPEDVAASLKEHTNNAGFVRALNHVVEMLGNRRMLPNENAGAPSLEERNSYRERLGSRAYFNDPREKAAVDDWYKANNPG